MEASKNDKSPTTQQKKVDQIPNAKVENKADKQPDKKPDKKEAKTKKPGFWSRVRGLVGRKEGEQKKAAGGPQSGGLPKMPEAKKPQAPAVPKTETGGSTASAVPRKRKRLFVPSRQRQSQPSSPTAVKANGPTGEQLAARIETRVEAALTSHLGKKDEAIVRLQEGFRGLTDRLDRIGDGLHDQSEHSKQILEHLSELPELLARMPEAAGREREILETIEREIGAQSEWGKAMVDALGDLPRLIEVVNEGGECEQAQLNVMRALSREVESQSRQRAKLLRSVDNMRTGIDKLVTEYSLAREQRTQMNETLETLSKSLGRLDHHGVEQKEVLREVARSSHASKDAVDQVGRTVHRAVVDAQDRTVTAMRHIEIERERRFKAAFGHRARQVAVVGGGLLVLFIGMNLIDRIERRAEPPDASAYMLKQAAARAAEAHARAQRTEEQLARVLGALETKGSTPAGQTPVDRDQAGADFEPSGTESQPEGGAEKRAPVPEPPFGSGETSLLFERPLRDALSPKADPMILQFGAGARSPEQLVTATPEPAPSEPAGQPTPISDGGAQ